jgi:hypothetical protein
MRIGEREGTRQLFIDLIVVIAKREPDNRDMGHAKIMENGMGRLIH